MPSTREFICVTCPVGCAISALVEGSELIEVHGHTCRRGIEFVREEISAPRRTLTTTVRVSGGALPLVPVRSSAPLPKGRVLEIAAFLRTVVLTAPVEARQVVVADVLGTGVDIVTTRALARAEAG